MKAALLAVTCTLVLSTGVNAQTDSLNAYAFDFWLGKWDLKWKNAKGETLKGQNHIIRILDGKVIQENFSSPTGFEGKSWTTYNAKTGSWHQTWVDNQSGYLTFEGQRSGDTVIFAMAPAITDSSYLERRMIFYDIEAERFTWDWQAKTAADSPWQLRWRIFYTRRP